MQDVKLKTECLPHPELLTAQTPIAQVPERSRGVLSTTQTQTRVLPDPACSQNRGEAATTLENYGRAAGADLTNSGRGAAAITLENYGRAAGADLINSGSGAAAKKNNYKILDMFKSAQERGKT